MQNTALNLRYASSLKLSSAATRPRVWHLQNIRRRNKCYADKKYHYRQQYFVIESIRKFRRCSTNRKFIRFHTSMNLNLITFKYIFCLLIRSTNFLTNIGAWRQVHINRRQNKNCNSYFSWIPFIDKMQFWLYKNSRLVSYLNFIIENKHFLLWTYLPIFESIHRYFGFLRVICTLSLYFVINFALED